VFFLEARTATQARLGSKFDPLSHRERVRVRGVKWDFFLFDPLTPALSQRERGQESIP
jgi:hypothetical protein